MIMSVVYTKGEGFHPSVNRKPHADVPAIGFDPKPVKTFVHGEEKAIPCAIQTCSNVLYLYVNGKTT